MHSNASTPLSIIVIGGGIGGLAASILLAQSGHSVLVLERKDAAFETRSTGGVALFRNAVHIIESMGLKSELADVADTGNTVTSLRYNSGEVDSVTPKTHPHSMIHRADLLRILYEQAVKMGVDVRFLVSIASIHDSPDQPTVKLVDGTNLQPDLLIGADGIESLTRRTIMPEISPQLSPCTVMLVTVPHSVMESSPGTSALYNAPAFYHFNGPGRSIVCWGMSRHQVYHLQFCDYEYGDGSAYSFDDPPSAPYITTISNMSGITKRWSDFEPRIQHILNSTTSYTKWKIAELPPLPSYASPSSRIVLLGDAAHAIQPFAGQGANMAIEDGAALSTLLSLISSKAEIIDAVKAYDKVRVPRLAGIREIIEMNVRRFGMKHGEEKQRRDRKLAVPNDAERRGKLAEKEGVELGWREYGGRERARWMEEFEVEVKARQAWMELKAGQGKKQVPANGKL